MTEEMLEGGVANAGAVVRHRDRVLRPATPHARSIHALLAHVHAADPALVPEPLGFAPGGRERLRFVPGRVARPPFPAWWQTNETLASTAALLRRYHDAVAGFSAPPDATWSAGLADPRGGALLCHNDVCPENVVHRDGRAVALIDFDYAAPGRAVYDLAQLAKMCVPLGPSGDAQHEGRAALDPIARLRVVADAYGLQGPDRAHFVDAIDDALAVGDRFVRAQVAQGVPSFVAMWRQHGGEQGAERRRRWYAAHRERLLDALG